MNIICGYREKMKDELSEQQISFQMNCLRQTTSERKYKERIQEIYYLGYNQSGIEMKQENEDFENKIIEYFNSFCSDLVGSNEYLEDDRDRDINEFKCFIEDKNEKRNIKN